MAMNTYDIIIIGGGPGGYIAAERAGALGNSVLLIEKEELGGVCLNKGCIPTKSLLHSAKLYHAAKNSRQFGVKTTGAKYDLQQALQWKDQVVTKQRNGVSYLMKKNKVDVFSGFARFIDRSSIAVDGNTFIGKNIIIATGSSPAKPPIKGIDLSHVYTSDEILQITEIPQNLVIIGGGIIGLEFASYFSMLDIPVTVIEMMPEIIPNFDQDTAALLRRAMPDVNFHLDARITEICERKIQFRIDGKQETIEAGTVLLAAGRNPNVHYLGLENINLDFNSSGIRVDEQMRTNLPGVYAIGDVTGICMLAHTASRMGEVAVNVINGKPDRMHYHAIPWVVYTNPEISGVGLTEKEAVERNIPVKVSKIPLRINGRFLAEHGDIAGMCKVIVDAKTDILLGVQIAGAANSEIIYGAVAMIEAEFRVIDLKEMIFPHPTVSEIIRDAVWGITG